MQVKEAVVLDDIQFRFMPGKGTTGKTCILRQAQEKSLESNRELYIAIVHLKLTYYRVLREVVHWCLRREV